LTIPLFIQAAEFGKICGFSSKILAGFVKTAETKVTFKVFMFKCREPPLLTLSNSAILLQKQNSLSLNALNRSAYTGGV